jgi:hypothetical protein
MKGQTVQKRCLICLGQKKGSIGGKILKEARWKKELKNC